MSQMNNNKKPAAWKSATPKAVQPLKQARTNMVNAVNNAKHAEKAVQNAPMGKHTETMKHLQFADKQSSGAQEQYSNAQKNAEKGRAMQGKAIGQGRKPQPVGLGAPKNTGVGMNSGATKQATGIKGLGAKIASKLPGKK
jgi:hypothetical protein